jgi:hypothetical protein
MGKKVLLALGLVTFLGGAATAERTSERTSRHSWKAADPACKRKVRLNRAVINLWGQEPNVAAVCGPQGASSVRTKANGWDALFGVVTIGLYTPQHAYIVCNPTTTM